jgi:hypothetical protein
MLTRVFLSLALLAAIPLWSQVDTNGAAGSANPADDARMAVPPAVSGQAYPTSTTSESRSNYLDYGVTFSTAYNDNVLGGSSANPVSDVNYSLWPTIALDETTPRLHSLVTYSPGFTFYQRTSSRNEADQNAAIDVQYRLSAHVTASLRDSFHKSSGFFNQPDLTAASPVYGSGQVPPVTVIAPLADQLSNLATAEGTYQFSADDMIGAGGVFARLHYPDPTQVPGLYDSSSIGGSAFYNRRLTGRQYIGVTYQYSRILAYPIGAQSEIQTQTVLLFYTVYLKPTLSLSFSGGPQHSNVVQFPLPAAQSWSPAAIASMGWQGRRASFATSYSQLVTGGGGLAGAFHSSSAYASARWQIARTWNVGLTASYATYSSLTPLSVPSSPGGHTIFGGASTQHQIGQHLSIEAGYDRLHQSYGSIATVSNAPDTNREFISISYRFARPLGR